MRPPHSVFIVPLHIVAGGVFVRSRLDGSYCRMPMARKQGPHFRSAAFVDFAMGVAILHDERLPIWRCIVFQGFYLACSGSEPSWVLFATVQCVIERAGATLSPLHAPGSPRLP